MITTLGLAASGGLLQLSYRYYHNQYIKLEESCEDMAQVVAQHTTLGNNKSANPHVKRYGHYRGRIDSANSQTIKTDRGISYEVAGVHSTQCILKDVVTTVYDETGNILRESTKRQTTKVADEGRRIFPGLVLTGIRKSMNQKATMELSILDKIPFEVLCDQFTKEGGDTVVNVINNVSSGEVKPASATSAEQTGVKKEITKQTTKYVGKQIRTEGVTQGTELTIIGDFNLVLMDRNAKVSHLNVCESDDNWTCVAKDSFHMIKADRKQKAELCKYLSWGCLGSAAVFAVFGVRR